MQLSASFFMRDFLYSEISQIHGIPNIPDDPELAIEAGTMLCEEVLEPIQAALGRISIRSAYRSCAVNAKGAENGNQYSCASNEANYAAHIWDRRDKAGRIGATACIVVNSFVPYYERTRHWQALAWWLHDYLPVHAGITFFPKLAAFNISWHETPTPTIYSQIPPDRGWLTKPGMANFKGSHLSEYQDWLAEISGYRSDLVVPTAARSSVRTSAARDEDAKPASPRPTSKSRDGDSGAQTAPTKFWRVGYRSKKQLEDVLSTGRLTLKGFLENDTEQLLANHYKRMGLGDGILIANLNETRQMAEVVAVGQIVRKLEGELELDLKETSFEFPITSRGLRYWRGHSVFNFAESVANRLALSALFTSG